MPRNAKEWLTEIESALQRPAEKRWREKTKEILCIYGAEQETPFNILFSNTETIYPSLYSNTPRPVVERRFRDEDPLGKAAAQAGQRVLEYDIDTNSEEYETFDEVLGDVVLDALLPGRGVARIRYDAQTSDYGKGDEQTCYSSVKYNRYCFGYARKWKDVPWFAFRHDVTRAEAEKLFGKEKIEKLTFTADDEDDDRRDKDQRTNEDIKTALVWEIWDKDGGREVRFVGEGVDEFLKEDPDPLELTGFYPVPKPLRFIRKSNDLSVTPPYEVYRKQAEELNVITQRLRRLFNAMRVRGIYDSSVVEFAQLFGPEGDDNALIPGTSSQLQDRKLEDAVWLVPIDKLVTVIQQLILARQQCKQTIYEITGLSDIIRGTTQASETARAQEIKTQWGAMRLKRMQKDVANTARDMLRISLEIAAKKYSPQTFMKVTGLPFPTAAEKQQAQMVAQAMQQTQQPIPPEMQKVLSSPSWEEVLGALRDDTQRQYKIDVETNSTVDLDATEDKKDLAELMNAMGQFINGVAPLVQAGALDVNAAKAMLLVIVRRFRFGPEIEDYIRNMQAPKAPDDGKAEAEKLKLQQAQMEFEQEKEIKQMDMGLKREEHQMKLEALEAEKQYNQLMAKIKMTEARQKADLQLRNQVAGAQIDAQKSQPAMGES